MSGFKERCLFLLSLQKAREIVKREDIILILLNVDLPDENALIL
jgi:response regulator of citrate/malate metabolism